jgi:hypothetical protein
MRSIRRTLRRPSLIPKTKRNRAFLLGARFKTLWRSHIHIILQIDADALNRRRRRFCVRRTMYHMKDSEGSILVSTHASTVYAVGRIKSKTKQDSPALHPNLT